MLSVRNFSVKCKSQNAQIRIFSVRKIYKVILREKFIRVEKIVSVKLVWEILVSEKFVRIEKNLLGIWGKKVSRFEQGASRWVENLGKILCPNTLLAERRKKCSSYISIVKRGGHREKSAVWLELRLFFQSSIWALCRVQMKNLRGAFESTFNSTSNESSLKFQHSLE